MTNSYSYNEQQLIPVFLHFNDTGIERKFIKDYDCDNRSFFRIGIYLSCVAWFIWYAGLYFSHREIFVAVTVLLIVLLAPFTLVRTLCAGGFSQNQKSGQ